MATPKPSRWGQYNAKQTERIRGESESVLSGRGLIEGRVLNPNGTIGRSRSDLTRGVANGPLMSTAVGISVEWQGLARIRELLERAAQVSPQAVARALNRTVEKARTDVTRALVKQTGLKFGTVRKATSLWRASAGSLTAEIRAKGGYTSLKEFSARQTKKGVSAAPWGRRQVFDHTFMVKRYGGHVYKREGKDRFPLRKLYGPAIPVEMVKGASRDAFFRAVESELPKRLDHELGRVLGGS
ncbi:phage tail protein [Xanthobacter oligotrophicus]|uniref:Phage tail protein n=1 Tax=Xanthobacter oligotrophicus TaxID=2607286 RepID=A0ABW6ZPQ9_9HYPH